MKKNKLFFISLLIQLIFVQTIHAQYINGLSIYPPNASTTDSIQLIASCYFQSGSCNQKTLNYSIMNQTIDCDAMHCVGMATYICYDVDTFNIGTLPAGSYTFRYTVNAGFGPMPCTPGIIAGPSDSICFIIGTTSSLSELNELKFTIGPNPANTELYINLLMSSNCIASIYTLNGKLIQEQLLSFNRSKINISSIPQGAYLLKIVDPNLGSQTKIFFKY